MENKKIIVQILGKSCSGKSSVAKTLAENIEEIFTVSYDRLKWQLSAYHRDKHTAVIREILIGLFEVVCKKGLPIILDFGFSNEKVFSDYKMIADKYGYRFEFVLLNPPDEILLDRFRNRVKKAKEEGTKISITDENLFIENLSKKWFTPKNFIEFNTSLMDKEVIVQQIMAHIFKS